MTNRVATLAKVRPVCARRKVLTNTPTLHPRTTPLRVKRTAFVLQEYLPADIQAQFSTSRELIRNIHNSFQKLRDRAEKMAERSKENATDLLMFGRELRFFFY